MEYRTLDCINKFKDYYEVEKENNPEFTQKELAYIWFSGNVCNCTFYDYGMDMKWGEKLYKTIKAVINDTQDEMLNEMYEEYLICLNLIGEDNFEWGSSIRYCWFENEDIRTYFTERVEQIKDIIEK